MVEGEDPRVALGPCHPPQVVCPSQWSHTQPCPLQFWPVHLYTQFLGGVTFVQLCTHLDRQKSADKSSSFSTGLPSHCGSSLMYLNQSSCFLYHFAQSHTHCTFHNSEHALHFLVQGIHLYSCSRSNITWEFVRNSESQASPQSSRVRICILTTSSGDW